MNHEFQFLKLAKFELEKPKIIPKINRLIKKKEAGGVVVAPRKKEEEYKY